MPISFNTLCPNIYVTTKCYTGQMVGVCLETTETTLSTGIPREHAWCKGSGLKEADATLSKRKHPLLYKKIRRTGSRWERIFYLQNSSHSHSGCMMFVLGNWTHSSQSQLHWTCVSLNEETSILLQGENSKPHGGRGDLTQDLRIQWPGNPLMWKRWATRLDLQDWLLGGQH